MNTARLKLFRIVGIAIVTALMVSSFGMLLPNGGTAFAQVEAKTIRVAANGADNSSCGAESAPCRSIQYAVNKAGNGDTILVAAGSYTYNSSADTCTFLNTRAVVCFVDKHLSIIGGYASGAWGTPNPTANPTIIDGAGSQRGVAVIAYNSTASLRMEGFTIQNSVARGKTSGSDYEISAYGGGLYAQLASVTLRSMIFKNNKAIGGNTATQYGGAGAGGGVALDVRNGTANILENVVFEGNQALGGTGTRRGGVALGGGFYTYQSVVNATNLTLRNNQAVAGDSSGSGIDTTYNLRADALGGGMAFSIGSHATLNSIEATDNYALGGDAGSGSTAVGGGGFGGFLHAEESPLSITDAEARGNKAIGGKGATGGVGFGGALMTDAENALIDRFVAIQNTAISGASLTGGNAGAPSGGGAYITDFDGSTHDATILNSIFADNGIEVGYPGTSVGGGGAGLVIQAMRATIEHTTFARNTFNGDLKSGQALVVHGLYGESGTPSVATLRYCIIADHVQPYTSNTSALTVSKGSTVTLQGVMFAGNTNNINTNSKPLPPGTINGLSSAVTVASIGFQAPGSPNYDYHLSNTSAAIDQAPGSSQTLDVDGEARPVFNAPDMGADEYSPQAISVSPSQVTAVVGNSTRYIKMVQVILPDPNGTWTATSNVGWLYLGDGTTQQQSGASGDYLVLNIEGSLVESGNQATTISITSATADPVDMPVNMLRVNAVYYLQLPSLRR